MEKVIHFPTLGYRLNSIREWNSSFSLVVRFQCAKLLNKHNSYFKSAEQKPNGHFMLKDLSRAREVSIKRAAAIKISAPSNVISDATLMFSSSSTSTSFSFSLRLSDRMTK